MVLAKRRLVKELFYRYRIPYNDLSDMRTDLTHAYFIINVNSIWKTAVAVISLKPQFEKVKTDLKDNE